MQERILMTIMPSEFKSPASQLQRHVSCRRIALPGTFFRFLTSGTWSRWEYRGLRTGIKKMTPFAANIRRIVYIWSRPNLPDRPVLTPPELQEFETHGIVRNAFWIEPPRRRIPWGKPPQGSREPSCGHLHAKRALSGLWFRLALRWKESADL